MEKDKVGVKKMNIPNQLIDLSSFEFLEELCYLSLKLIFVLPFQY
jgi:hypothetical protein